MAILLDPARWPAHGRLWAHLVSDTSLAELHDFAARCDVPRRAFDLDHYDVPAERHADLVTAGAQQVSGRELIHRLRGSGLRVAAVDRPRRRDLLRRWAQLVPDAPEVGEELVARWSEPHRTYHGPHHLRAVLEHLAVLSAGGERVPRAVVLAAWFHDAVHDGASPDDELASAQLAEHLLQPLLEQPDVAEVSRLVRLTATHDPSPRDAAGQVLCDADLAVLGGPAAAYRRYTEQVREEYRDVPETDFRRGRAAILRRFLERPAIYRTATGRSTWEHVARANLAAELAALEDR